MRVFYVIFIVAFFCSPLTAQFRLIKDFEADHCGLINDDKDILGLNGRGDFGVKGGGSYGNKNALRNRGTTGPLGYYYSAVDGTLRHSLGPDTLRFSEPTYYSVGIGSIDFQGNIYDGEAFKIDFSEWSRWGERLVFNKYNTQTHTKRIVKSVKGNSIYYENQLDRPKTRFAGKIPSLRYVTWSHSGKYCVSRKWGSENILTEFSTGRGIFKLPSSDFRFSRNDKMIAIFEDDRITIFRTEDGAQLKSMRVPIQSKIKQLVFSHDNSLMIALSSARTSNYTNSSEDLFENISDGNTLSNSTDFDVLSEFDLKSGKVRHRKFDSSGRHYADDFIDVDSNLEYFAYSNFIYSYETLNEIFKAREGSPLNYKKFSNDGTRFLSGSSLYEIKKATFSGDLFE